METDRCDAKPFLHFFVMFFLNMKINMIVMILDNARIHHAKLIQPFLKEHEDRLTLLFLPPYSPNLNAVERVWGWLKKSVIANRFHATREDIRKSVLSFLEYLHEFPEKVIRLIGSMAMSEI